MSHTVLFPFRRKRACPKHEHFIDNLPNVNSRRNRQICENEDLETWEPKVPQLLLVFSGEWEVTGGSWKWGSGRWGDLTSGLSSVTSRPRHCGQDILVLKTQSLQRSNDETRITELQCLSWFLRSSGLSCLISQVRELKLRNVKLSLAGHTASARSRGMTPGPDNPRSVLVLS